MAKGKETPKMTDAQKEAKFKELAGKRVNRALKAINGLSKLAAPRYKYTSAQVEKMEAAFRDALSHCFGAFRGQKTGGQGFTL